MNEIEGDFSFIDIDGDESKNIIKNSSGDCKLNDQLNLNGEEKDNKISDV